MPETEALTRSWTFVSPRRKPRKIKVPEVNTYFNQIQECNTLHSKLQLPTRTEIHRISHFPDISSFPHLTSPHFLRSAPQTAFHVNADSCSPRFAWHVDIGISNPDAKLENPSTQTSKSSVTVESEANFEDNHELKRSRHITPHQLTEHLRTHGYGEPLVLVSTSLKTDPKYNSSHHTRSRALPKDPSSREKIKGRARLDYEMANMRAMAFCEQQKSTKVFRSASANMRNRDVQFVEDEMREKMHKDDTDTRDETEGVVVMGVDREELFQRVNTWIEQVECACKEVT